MEIKENDDLRDIYIFLSLQKSVKNYELIGLKK